MVIKMEEQLETSNKFTPLPNLSKPAAKKINKLSMVASLKSLKYKSIKSPKMHSLNNSDILDEEIKTFNLIDHSHFPPSNNESKLPSIAKAKAVTLKKSLKMVASLTSLKLKVKKRQSILSSDELDVDEKVTNIIVNNTKKLRSARESLKSLNLKRNSRTKKSITLPTFSETEKKKKLALMLHLVHLVTQIINL